MQTLTYTVYTCPGCKHQQVCSGKCPSCKRVLEMDWVAKDALPTALVTQVVEAWS